MSLTTGAVVAGASGSIMGSIISGALQVLKIVASVAFAVIFAAAIVSLCGMVESFITTTIIGEFFLIVSMCLPFNAVAVFGAIYLVLTGVLLFLVARKGYTLVSSLIQTSGH